MGNDRIRNTPLFEISRLTRTFLAGEVEVQALRGVDLTIAENEMLVLLGPSGSGKSTFLNIVGGLDRPSSGSLVFRGQSLSDWSHDELTQYRRDHVGFIFQFYNLIPSLTARENVSLVTEIAHSPMDAADALALVGLSHRLDHFPAQLSGGEQQRVAVARAVAKRPEVLFCDEPTGALDSQTGVTVLEVLQSVNREFDTTTLVITHNVSIAKIADRVVRFADGRVAQISKNAAPMAAAEITW